MRSSEIARVRAGLFALAAGYRGALAADLEALGEIIADISRFVAQQGPRAPELDASSLRVSEQARPCGASKTKPRCAD